MVSRTAAEQAIRKHAQGRTLKGLLGFLQDQSDDQLSQWSIRDVDGDEAIFTYFRLTAARDGNISLHTDQGDGDQLVASVACWWPACWLKSVVPMWQVREDEGSRQQQQEQQQHQNACTMPAAAAPHSASVDDTHTPAATSPGRSPSCFQPPPSQHLSACRQRRSQRAGPQ
ncbi:hypothetical protein CHLRE_02g143407v5 [Chlamydomonas reinhardtii]|uniref:Uncharacterized protein n=1 Tax=Chlamydomonas reinhardtii TaxID=3055 RepID=A0A2K3E4J8_CHLRE|nr:uncharacterized protein CHLRE_02g143407v5 [Chlamydomonas reinhardtii]PNW87721.1 hypothetical protein CHLRE_02g143407v5 [Chlamydomonas reinhardtii]